MRRVILECTGTRVGGLKLLVYAALSYYGPPPPHAPRHTRVHRY
jgi:hypothetical protein